jgi:hypothetical protein
MKKVIPLVLLVSSILVIMLVNYFGLMVIPQTPWRYADEILVEALSLHKLVEKSDGTLELNTYMPTNEDTEDTRPDMSQDDEGRAMFTINLGFYIKPDDATINARTIEDDTRVSIAVTDNAHYNIPEEILDEDEPEKEIEDPNNPDGTITVPNMIPNPDYMAEYFRVEILESHLYIYIYTTGFYTVRIKVNEPNGAKTAEKIVKIAVYSKEWYDEYFGEGNGMG